MAFAAQRLKGAGYLAGVGAGWIKAGGAALGTSTGGGETAEAGSFRTVSALEAALAAAVGLALGAG